jgi:hypothetical protein
MALGDLRLAAGTIRIERRGVGLFELHRGVLRVELDGRRAAVLADYGSAVDISAEPGVHTLQVLVGRYSSAVREVEVFDGGLLSFRTHGAMLWPRYVVSLVKPHLGISLHRV